jgi:hypothetical protein
MLPFLLDKAFCRNEIKTGLVFSKRNQGETETGFVRFRSGKTNRSQPVETAGCES